MPNHCNNELTITSDNAGLLQSLMNELKQADSYEIDFLSKLVPFTEETNYVWDYDWCVRMWDTKWDIFDVNYASLDGDTLTVSFTTAWSPPIGALVRGAVTHGYEFKLHYCEDGAAFVGYAEGDQEAYSDMSFETFTETHPNEYIPEDVLDEWPHLVSDWEEWQQERDQEELKELQGA
jgi:hypothetical protein